MTASFIDGAAMAAAIERELADEVRRLGDAGVRPGLAVVLVGGDPASAAYVNMKARTCERLGLLGRKLMLPESTSTAELLDRIDALNRDEAIDGILVQLPLPAHIDKAAVLEAVAPAKDVDGFHPSNMGGLVLGRDTLVACTPLGIMEMLRRSGVDLDCARAVVLGRSDDVGKPMALLLLHANATVTICHSRTRSLAAICREADVLVAAMGRLAMVTGDFVKPGAVVVDVGSNPVTDRNEVIRLFGPETPRLAQFDRRGHIWAGDVHEREVAAVAAKLTPSPGGVGPMTIAMLMKNTLQAARTRRARP